MGLESRSREDDDNAPLAKVARDLQRKVNAKRGGRGEIAAERRPVMGTVAARRGPGWEVHHPSSGQANGAQHRFRKLTAE